MLALGFDFAFLCVGLGVGLPVLTSWGFTGPPPLAWPGLGIAFDCPVCFFVQYSGRVAVSAGAGVVSPHIWPGLYLFNVNKC